MLINTQKKFNLISEIVHFQKKKEWGYNIMVMSTTKT